VWMIQRGDGASLALEAGEPFGIAGHLGGEDLEGYVAAELGVGRPIHLAHPAGTDGSGNSIMRKCSADQIEPPASLAPASCGIFPKLE
jgi:hypothetical protein